MRKSLKLHLKAVEYLNRHNASNTYRISFPQAVRAAREAMTDEEKEMENAYVLCCVHGWQSYLINKTVHQCDECIKLHGYIHFASPHDASTGNSTEMPWSIYARRRSGKSEDSDFDFDAIPGQNPKSKKTKKEFYSDHTKLISMNYKGKRAFATVKNGQMVYNKIPYDKPQKAALAAMEDIAGKTIPGYASKFWSKYEGEITNKLEWSDKAFVADPDGVPKRGRKGRAKTDEDSPTT